jgi:hypothetical protein
VFPNANRISRRDGALRSGRSDANLGGWDEQPASGSL